MIRHIMEGLHQGTAPDDLSHRQVDKGHAVPADVGNSMADVNVRYEAPGFRRQWRLVTCMVFADRAVSTSRYLTTLYNATTILTITTGVVFASAVIFLLLLGAAAGFTRHRCSGTLSGVLVLPFTMS
jgi:hypothetical protein